MKRIPDGDAVHASRRSLRAFGLHGAWAGAIALVLACAANPADEPTSLATTSEDTGEDEAAEEGGPPATDDGGEAEGGSGPGADFGPEAAPCDDYLACLLLTCPECTAGALQLYGEESACWDNETQATMCDQACDDLLVEMTDTCQCADGSCAACTPRLEIRYQPDTPSTGKEYWLACDDGTQIDAGPWEISVEYVDGREVIIAFESVLGPGRLLRGTHPCAGETFQAFGTVEEEGGAYSEHWIATLTPTPNAQTLSMVIVGAFSYASGSMRRCSLSADLQAW